MRYQDRVREVFPNAVVSTSSGRAVVYSAVGGERLGESNRQDRAWALAWREIERRGTHHLCPYCGVALEPFMGDEDGPVTGWYHPETGAGCCWDDYENLNKRQIYTAAAKRLA